MSQHSDVSIFDCTDSYKHDINTSLYIYVIEEATIDNKIKWSREWNNFYMCYFYNGTYVNKNGLKVDIVFECDYNTGYAMNIAYHNHGKIIKTLHLTEELYYEELDDLEEAIRLQFKGNRYDKPIKTKYKETKVLNSRGIKAEKLLKDVEFEYNCQILGQIDEVD